MADKEANSAVIRVHKDKNYTVMSNEHLLFTKPPMSLKAKGLLSMFLALPDDWNYSISGLSSICKESRDCIRSTMDELKQYGYLKIEKQNGEKGKFIYVYHIFERSKNKLPDTENPHLDDPHLEVPSMEDPGVEKPTQLNTNKINTDKQNKDKISFGEFSNVFLSEDEIKKLNNLYKTESNFNKAIEILSSYKASSGKKYKSDYAVLNKSNWIYPKIFPEQNNQTAVASTAASKYSGYHTKQGGMQ